VQYLLVYTSRAEGVGQVGEWRRNGAGIVLSDKYGFGAVDAEALVSRARHWRPVPAQQTCSQQQPLLQLRPRYREKRRRRKREMRIMQVYVF